MRLKFLRLSSEILRSVVWQILTDVSEVLTAFIVRTIALHGATSQKTAMFMGKRRGYDCCFVSDAHAARISRDRTHTTSMFRWLQENIVLYHVTANLFTSPYLTPHNSN
jgi:hypothetical protein